MFGDGFMRRQIWRSCYSLEKGQLFCSKHVGSLQPSLSANISLLNIRGRPIQLQKSEITDVNVDVIVNLIKEVPGKFSGGYGGVCSAAGSCVIRILNLLGTGTNGICVTDGGDLKCKKIIHVVCEKKFSDIETSVAKALEECEKNSLKTAAIVAVGTEEIGIDAQTAAVSILGGIGNYLTTCPASCVSEIHLIALSLGIYEDYLNVFKYRRINSRIALSNHVICDKSVTLKMGDITDENVDAIVNLTNKELNRHIGVSGVIFSAAGAIVTAECQKIGPLPDDGAAATTGGNLKCKKIIHLVAPKTSASIVTSVEKVLQVCENRKITTVAIPAIGTGRLKIDVHESIRSILDGIKNHFLKFPESCLEEIRIIAFYHYVYQCYFHELQKLYTQYEIMNMMLGGTNVLLKLGDITNETVDAIVNVNDKTWTKSTGISGAILSSAGKSVVEECQLLAPGIKVAVTGAGNLRSQKIIHILPSRWITTSVENVLQKCEEYCLKSVAFPAIGTGLGNIEAQSSMAMILDGIENHLSKLSNSCLEEICINTVSEHIHCDYQTVFRNRYKDEQALSDQMFSLQIDIPTSWRGMDVNDDFMVVNLQNDSQEYKEVSMNFIRTSKSNLINIIKIERIQNVKLWRSYSVKRQSVEKKYPHQLNERHLYHGTSSDAIMKINRYGFNRSYCGKNAFSHGQGTYFAKEAEYSCHDTYSRPDENGQKYIYQAAVITGKYCAGKSSYKEPPHISEDPEEDLYGCVVNKVQDPTAFIVFWDDCAYPEYLITFKKS